MYHYGYSYFNDNFIFVADLIFYIYKIAISDDLSIHAAESKRLLQMFTLEDQVSVNPKAGHCSRVMGPPNCPSSTTESSSDQLRFCCRPHRRHPPTPPQTELRLHLPLRKTPPPY